MQIHFYFFTSFSRDLLLGFAAETVKASFFGHIFLPGTGYMDTGTGDHYES